MTIELKAKLHLTKEEYNVLTSAFELLEKIADEMPEGNQLQELAFNTSSNIDTFLTYYEDEAE